MLLGRLGRIADMRAVEPLIGALNDSWDGVRRAAVQFLGMIKDRRAIDKIIPLLADEDRGVRCAAVEALGSFQDSKLLPHIINSLNDQDWQVRHDAVMVLEKIPDKKDLLAVLADALADWQLGPQIAKILEESGWKPQTQEEKIHFLVVKRDRDGLKQNWARTKQVLFRDIHSNNLIKIEFVLLVFVGIGEEEALQDLFHFLQTKGTPAIAEAYLNCGNEKLRVVAEVWAKERGYTIQSMPGGSGLGWGFWN